MRVGDGSRVSTAQGRGTKCWVLRMCAIHEPAPSTRQGLLMVGHRERGDSDGVLSARCVHEWGRARVAVAHGAREVEAQRVDQHVRRPGQVA